MKQNKTHEKVTVKAYAKLNLFLEITDKLPNGYHSLNSVMQTVSLADTVTVSVKKAEKTNIKITCINPLIPLDSKNIAWRAAEAFLKTANENAEIEIDIDKKIPLEAGLGGSSTDGAAVLTALNTVFNHALTDGELMLIGGGLGADVPFCIKTGACLCTGTGADVTELPDISCAFVIIKPNFSCSTAHAYNCYDESKEKFKSAAGFEEFVTAVKNGKFLENAKNMYNVFEELYKLPEISEIKEVLMKSGARGAALTGSGSAVFGVYADESAAERAYKIVPYQNKYTALSIKKA